MRDFYDIYILTTTQSFDANIFKLSLQKTVKKRETIEQMKDMYETIMMIGANPLMIDRCIKPTKI